MLSLKKMKRLEVEKVMKCRFIVADQPAGRFYITKMNAKKLIPLCQSRERTPYNTTGIQRKLNDDRVRDIEKYCRKATAMFPTPIILSADSDYFVFYNEEGDKIETKHRKDEDKYVDINSGYMEINSEDLVNDCKYFSIVDGQHRLAGIDASNKAEDFDLLVMFVFDTQAFQDAEIFSVINRNQKQVSKSLVYDLYGLTDEVTVEKFAHEIVKSLNTMKFSSLKNRIKMLGYKADAFKKDDRKQYVSQAAIVDELLPMISKDIYSDNECVKKGQAIDEPYDDGKQPLRKYFYDDDLVGIQIRLIGFFNAWIDKIGGKFKEEDIIFKTVGFIASLEIFKRMGLIGGKPNEDLNIGISNLNDIKKEDWDVELTEQVKESIEHYQSIYLKKLDSLAFDSLEIEFISSSRSGATKIYKNLLKEDKEGIK